MKNIFLTVLTITGTISQAQSVIESQITFKPISEIRGKRSVFVNVIPRNRVPGIVNDSSPWVSNSVWKPDMFKVLSKWECMTHRILLKNGFKVVAEQVDADFSIYIGSDGWSDAANNNERTMFAFIVSVESNIHPALNSPEVYYQYRVMEYNPYENAPRIKQNAWLVDGLIGFIRAYQGR